MLGEEGVFGLDRSSSERPGVAVMSLTVPTLSFRPTGRPEQDLQQGLLLLRSRHVRGCCVPRPGETL